MSLQTIVGGGALTRKNIDTLNSNFAALQTVDYWVRPQNYVSGADGTYAKPYASMAAVTPKLKPGIVVGLDGVLWENYTAPLGVNDVTIVGMGNQPRQATTGGVAVGGGATWLSPSGGTTALIIVQAQGWTIRNIYFNNSATAAAAIELNTVGDPPLEADAAHFQLIDCILTGTDDGLAAPDGTNFVRLINCTFFGFSGASDIAISAAGSIGTLLDWRILGCKFFNNTSNIIAALSHGTISGCVFEAGTTSTLNLTSGVAPNFVVGNYFDINAADFDPAGGVTGVTGDTWSNTLKDAIETGLPAN